MYEGLNILTVLAVLAAIIYFGWQRRKVGALSQKKGGDETIEPLSAFDYTHEHEEKTERAQPLNGAYEEAIEMLGLVGIKDAGGTFMFDCPPVDPQEEWESDAVVISICQATPYISQTRTRESLLYVELDGRMLIVLGGRAAIGAFGETRDRDGIDLEREYEEAVRAQSSSGQSIGELERGTAKFRDQQYKVKTAVGGSHDGQTDEIRCLYVHPDVGKPDGQLSYLAPVIAQGQTQFYQDIRLIQEETGERVYGFCVGAQTWFVITNARVLERAELERISII